MQQGQQADTTNAHSSRANARLVIIRNAIIARLDPSDPAQRAFLQRILADMETNVDSADAPAEPTKSPSATMGSLLAKCYRAVVRAHPVDAQPTPSISSNGTNYVIPMALRAPLREALCNLIADTQNAGLLSKLQKNERTKAIRSLIETAPTDDTAALANLVDIVFGAVARSHQNDIRRRGRAASAKATDVTEEGDEDEEEAPAEKQQQKEEEKAELENDDDAESRERLVVQDRNAKKKARHHK